MKIVGVVQRYIYHVLYEFGLFTITGDGFIVVELNAMLNNLKPTRSRRHLPLLTVHNQKNTCVPVQITDRYSSRGKREANYVLHYLAIDTECQTAFALSAAPRRVSWQHLHELSGGKKH